MNHFIIMPQLNLMVDGRMIATTTLRLLTSLRVHQALSLPTQCELSFNYPSESSSDMKMWRLGAELQIAVQGLNVSLFVGQVTAIEHIYSPAGKHEIRVRGYDILHVLRKRQSVRAYVQMTPHELAQELVANLDLTVSAAVSSSVHQRIIQHGQSDFDLLSELLEQCGLYFTLRDKILHLITLEGLNECIPLKLGESLLEARIELNGDSAVRSVNVSSWNPLGVEPFVGRANQVRSSREVAAAVFPEQLGGTGERGLVDEDSVTADHIDMVAQAELDRCFAREVIFWGVARGDTGLRPGSGVDISGVEDSLAGRYVLTSVTHTIDARKGFISELSTEPLPVASRSRSLSAALGVVTQVDDPAGLGRVRVTLSAYNNVETEWMQVVSAAAGIDKGLVALPNKDDNVLVLLTHQNPTRGIILGGLYGPHAPYDSGVTGNAVHRYMLRTADGNIVQLDGQKHTIRIQNSQGSFVELAPTKVRIHAATDFELSAPGRSIVICADNIDFHKA